MVDISFLALKDQLASMLGADESEDLPPVDQNRLGICLNQAYRAVSYTHLTLPTKRIV